MLLLQRRYYDNIKLKLSFITNEDIVLDFSRKCSKVECYLESLPFVQFDSKIQKFKCNVKYYYKVIKEIKKINTNLPIEVEEIPKFVLKIFGQDEPHVKEINLSKNIEPTLAEKLKPLQKEGVYFAISRKGKILIADDMGLGKTHQAIALADFYRNDWPLLVATTSSMRPTWVEKLEELLPQVDPGSIVNFSSSNQDIDNGVRIVVTTYKMLKHLAENLESFSFGTVVLDESQNIKNYKTNQFKSTKKICNLAKRIILLSGTPAMSRPSELFTQMSLISPGFATFSQFAYRYCAAFHDGYGLDARGASNCTELEVLLKKRFMIRRTKHENLELTDKYRQRIILSCNIDRSNRRRLKRDLFLYNRNIDNFFRFYSDSAEVKLPAVMSFLKTFIQETTQKIIIFAFHLIMLDKINDVLNELEETYIRIDGATNNEMRHNLINYFQRDDDCRIALMSLGACATGITLTAAKTVVFAELTFTPAMLEQAESRAHRMGQTEDVQIKFLHVRGTIDDILWPMVIKKQDVLKSIGLNEKNFNENYYAERHVRALTPVSSSDESEEETDVLSSDDNETDVEETENEVSDLINGDYETEEEETESDISNLINDETEEVLTSDDDDDEEENMISISKRKSNESPYITPDSSSDDEILNKSFTPRKKFRRIRKITSDSSEVSSEEQCFIPKRKFKRLLQLQSSSEGEE